MGHEEQYELWKEQRAKVEPPADFAERVMASVHRTRGRAGRFFLERLMAVAWTSRVFRVGVYALAFAVWMMRVASLFLVFVPSRS